MVAVFCCFSFESWESSEIFWSAGGVFIDFLGDPCLPGWPLQSCLSSLELEFSHVGKLGQNDPCQSSQGRAPNFTRLANCSRQGRAGHCFQLHHI